MIDLTGQKFGKLTVLKHLETEVYRGALYECKCDCGNITIASTGELRSGNKKSCGCSRLGRRETTPEYCSECGNLFVYARGLCRRCYMKWWEEKHRIEMERYL